MYAIIPWVYPGSTLGHAYLDSSDLNDPTNAAHKCNNPVVAAAIQHEAHCAVILAARLTYGPTAEQRSLHSAPGLDNPECCSQETGGSHRRGREARCAVVPASPEHVHLAD